MVAMGLYRKGASLGQVMAFIIASPWNSLTLNADINRTDWLALDIGLHCFLHVNCLGKRHAIRSIRKKGCIAIKSPCKRHTMKSLNYGLNLKAI